VIQHMFLKFVLDLIAKSLHHQKGVSTHGGSSASDSPFGFPTRVVVVFDAERHPEAISIRRELYPEYKVRASQPCNHLYVACGWVGAQNWA
jgi:hypothetical protein